MPSVFIRLMASKKKSNRSKKVALGTSSDTIEVGYDLRRLPKSVKLHLISLIFMDFHCVSLIFIDFDRISIIFIDFH